MTHGPDRTAVAMAVGEPLDEHVLDGTARIDPVEVPGLAEVAVFSVRDDSGPHPVRVELGRLPDGDMVVLTGDQPAWDRLVAAVGASIGDAATAEGYVRSYLAETRGAMVVVKPVSTLDELPWRPGSDGEEASKAALLADPPALTPVAEPSGDGFHVELTLVVDDRLQRNSFDVARDGTISASYEVLADGLPFPIAL